MDILGTVRQPNQVRIRGTEIRVHPSLLAIIVLILLDHFLYPSEPYFSYQFLIVLLLSLAIHEIGHMIAAACLGIKIRDINLYPFGAIPSYTRRISPGAEFFVNAAGLISSMALFLLFLPFTEIAAMRRTLSADTFPAMIVLVNTLLIGINLLPLAATDSGRMLRAVLTLWQLSFAQVVLKRVNQMLSVAFLAVALAVGHPILYAAAAVVTIICFKEQLRMQTSDAAIGLLVKDALIEQKHLTILPHNLTVSSALPLVIKSLQNYFPVLHNDNLRGVIERDTFLRQVAGGVADDYISTLANAQLPAFNENDDLAVTLDEMFRSHAQVAIVFASGKQFRGLLVRSKAVEYVLLNNSVVSPGTP